MTARVKRLYRAVATYADGKTTTRHFQSRRACLDWAKQRREGYPEEWGESGRSAIPAAVQVVVETSDPITWGSA